VAEKGTLARTKGVEGRQAVITQNFPKKNACQVFLSWVGSSNRFREWVIFIWLSQVIVKVYVNKY
jgi:hypothetical protein